ncbi:hypothetical protein ACJA23_03535 [Mycoplasma corogypsi]|uniref:hypothetical protein n=1 Tax=Mycoplasma corogypsi TaxID=2106 RepID=UPI0038737634
MKAALKPYLEKGVKLFDFYIPEISVTEMSTNPKAINWLLRHANKIVLLNDGTAQPFRFLNDPSPAKGYISWVRGQSNSYTRDQLLQKWNSLKQNVDPYTDSNTGIDWWHFLTLGDKMRLYNIDGTYWKGLREYLKAIGKENKSFQIFSYPTFYKTIPNIDGLNNNEYIELFKSISNIKNEEFTDLLSFIDNAEDAKNYDPKKKNVVFLSPAIKKDNNQIATSYEKFFDAITKKYPPTLYNYFFQFHPSFVPNTIKSYLSNTVVKSKFDIKPLILKNTVSWENMMSFDYENLSKGKSIFFNENDFREDSNDYKTTLVGVQPSSTVLGSTIYFVKQAFNIPLEKALKYINPTNFPIPQNFHILTGVPVANENDNVNIMNRIYKQYIATGQFHSVKKFPILNDSYKQNIWNKDAVINAIYASKYLMSQSVVNSLKDYVNSLSDTDPKIAQIGNKLVELANEVDKSKSLLPDSLTTKLDFAKKYYNASNKVDFDNSLDKLTSIYTIGNNNSYRISNDIRTKYASNSLFWTSEFLDKNNVFLNSLLWNDGDVLEKVSKTFEIIKKANTELDKQLKELNGDTQTETHTFNLGDNKHSFATWDNHLPKIEISDYSGDGVHVGSEHSNNTEEQLSQIVAVKNHDDQNKTKLDEWFQTHFNGDTKTKVELELIKQLGVSKFKNSTLSDTEITFKHVHFIDKVYSTPVVTFTVNNANNSENSTHKVSLVIRNIFNSSNNSQVFSSVQGTHFTAAPGAKNTGTPNINDVEYTSKYVNVYLNYEGAPIPIDGIPLKGNVGNADNKSLNGTSIVEHDTNNKFSDWFLNTDQGNAFLDSIVAYINSFDPKFANQRAYNDNRTVLIDGVSYAETKSPATGNQVDNDNRPQLRIWNFTPRQNVLRLLQQVKGDTEAVYLPIGAATNQGWINTFLIRIPLSKFIDKGDLKAYLEENKATSNR